ncbi:MAG: flagellar hook capping protein [Ignavibacteriae bacterium HGW-Ignavibacteriae-3]|nr:MAG: flagellar hook capping protein [Ignavibacteriae bacterium HGW-Ignavibacteriae-3]
MVDPITTGNISSNAAAKGKTSLGKDDFMRLMISQLKNQDPLNPMDGTAFSAQLAQFSSLEQLTNLNDYMKQSIDANAILTQSINNTLITNMIGKEVKITGGNLKVNGQDSMTIGYTLPAEARSAQLKIYNEAGGLVKIIDGIPTSSGSSKLSWDLTDNNGNKLPNGKYKFEVDATNLSGDKMRLDLFKVGLLEGVRFTENGTVLIVNGSEYSISEISEVKNPH